MRRLGHALTLIVLLATAACAGPEVVSTVAPLPAAAPAPESDREILVTFVDRGLARTPNASPGDYVRSSADYQSTPWSQGVSAELARDYGLATVAEWPIRTLGVHCVVYGVREGQSLDEVMGRLAKDPRVGAVQRMHSFHVLTAADPYRRLQTSLPAMRVEAVHRWTTGRNVRIAIIDTGVDLAHPDLVDQVEAHGDMAEEHGAFGDDIHGTAVAGVIAALSGNGQGIVGVAPEARLITLRACWPERPGEIGAICNSLTLAKALDTAIHLQPQILNLSLTGPPDPLVEALLRAAVADRIIVVAAEPERLDGPGFARRVDGLIHVRAATEPGAVLPTDLAQETLAAPGHEVLTTFPHGTYNFISGSSFAAANVSGLIALLLELRPDLTARQTKDLLSSRIDRPTPVGTPRLSEGIDACAAVTRLRPGLVCADSYPAGGVQASRAGRSRVAAAR